MMVLTVICNLRRKEQGTKSIKNKQKKKEIIENRKKMGKWLHFVPENIPAVQAQTVIMFIFLFLFSFISFISVLFCLFMLSSSSLSVLLFLLVFDCLVSVITISDRPFQKPNCGLFVTTWRSEGTFILCRFKIDTFVYTYRGLNQKKINNSLLVLNCPN